MPSTIEKRGRCSWRVSISAGYNIDQQRVIRKTFRFPSSWSDRRQRREAEKQAALLYAEYVSSNPSPSRDMIFQDFAFLWLNEYAKINMQPRTLHECKIKLSLRIIPSLGKLKLSEIRPLTITKFVNLLIDSEVPGHADRKLSPQTIAHYQSLLSSMFSTAVRWELVTSNPCSKVKKPRVPSRPMHILDETESALLLVHLEAAPQKYRCVVYLGIMTGLRLGEIVALKWSDIDYDLKRLQVIRSRSYVPGKGSFDKSPKNDSSVRKIALPDIVIHQLDLLKAEQCKHAAENKGLWLNLDYIFTSWNGQAMGHNTVSSWFKCFLDQIRRKQQTDQIAAGVSPSNLHLIPMIRFHDLRHTHATLLLAEGVDIETVRLRLGHARASTTANIYCHPLPSKDRLAAGIIERLLSIQN